MYIIYSIVYTVEVPPEEKSIPLATIFVMFTIFFTENLVI